MIQSYVENTSIPHRHDRQYRYEGDDELKIENFH